MKKSDHSKSSRFPGFGKLTREQRIKCVSSFTGIAAEKLENIFNPGYMGGSYLEGLIENQIGGFTLPIGIAPNFVINDKPYLIPMAVEESSVIAAAAYGAKLSSETGGFVSRLQDNVMIGQLQFLLLDDMGFSELSQKLSDQETEILAQLNQSIPKLVDRGGGVRTLYCRGPYTYRQMTFASVQFDVDVRDAMGANTVNTLAEFLGEILSDRGLGSAHTAILSNLASKRVVNVSCKIRLADLGPEKMWEEMGRRLHLTQGFAHVDPFRAATHNKGIMNGVDAVLIATGNDWRANEAGAHAFAALGGVIKPLSHWEIEAPYVYGHMQIPMQVGVVGGVTRIHPLAKLCLEIMGITSGQELSEVAAAVGLAQNFSAIRALAFEGIQKGHMRLHQNNIVRHNL